MTHSRIRPALLWSSTGAAILLFVIATATSVDTDLWGHLRFGLDTLHSHALPSLDPYSFTQDKPWINHEWLSEWQMAAAYVLGGVAGLALLKGAVVFGTLVLLWRSLRRVELTPRMVVIAAVAMSMAPVTRTLRPQLWTCLCLAVLCRTLIEDDSRMRRWLPLMFAFWANCHGGWVVGFGVLGVWAAVDVLIERRRFWNWAVLLCLCLLATLVTPYGWKLWDFLHGTVSMSRAITEWQPLWRTEALNWVPWSAGVACIALVVADSDRHRWRAAAVLTMLAYSALRVSRIGPLFVECGGILIAPTLARRWPRDLSRAIPEAGGERLVAGTIVALSLAGAAWIGSRTLTCLDVEGTWVPDRQAARLLDDAAQGRLVTFFNWGEYAIWHWGPKLRVSMDGRRETIYSDQTLDGHQDILDGNTRGIALLDAWKAEYVWLPASSQTTKAWLEQHGYRIEFEDAASFVAVRDDLPRLRSNPASHRPEGCFPG